MPPEIPRERERSYYDRRREISRGGVGARVLALGDTTAAENVKVEALSERADLPPALVRGDVAEVERDVLREDTSARLGKIESAHPQLYDWVAKEGNLEKSYDDLDFLEKLSWYTQQIENAFVGTNASVSLSELAFKEIMRQPLTEDEHALRRIYRQRATLADTDVKNYVARVPIESAKMLPYMWEGVKGAGVAGVAGAVVGGLGGFAIAGPAGAALGAKTAGGLAARGGAAYEIFQLEAGLAYDEMIQMTGADGQPMDDDIARGAALWVGAINAGLESVSLGMFFRAASPAKRAVTREAIQKIVRKRVGETTARKAFREAGVKWVESIGTEAVTEAIQEAVQVWQEAGAAHEAFGPDLPGIEKRDAQFSALEAQADRIASAGGAALLATIGLGAPGFGVSFTGSKIKERRARVVPAKLDRLDELKRESNIAKRGDESTFNQAAAAVLEGQQPVYIEAARLFEYAEKNPGVIEEVFDKANSLNLQKVADAAAGGLDVEVPIADWMSAIAGTEHHQALKMLAKADPSSLSVLETEVESEAQAAQLELTQAQAEETAAIEAAETATRDQEIETATVAIEAQILKTKRFLPNDAHAIARFYAAGLATSAKRSGVPVSDLLGKIHILGPGQEIAQDADSRLLGQPRVQAAALVVGDRVFIGRTHADAFEAAEEAGMDIDIGAALKEGFLMDDGRFLSRAEALQATGLRAETRGAFTGVLTSEDAAEQGEPIADALPGEALFAVDDGAGQLRAQSRTYTQPAYHGTPHDFDVFDLSKALTGEGSTAFGHGVYLAGKQAVADWYRRRLVAMLPEGERLSKEGQLFEVDVPEDHELLDWDRRMLQQPSDVLDKILPSVRLSTDVGPVLASEADSLDHAIDSIAVDGAWVDVSLGRSFERIGGSTLYQTLAKALGKERASHWFFERGVPGLRFLDQVSRVRGEGTHNYVIWDETRLDVTRKFFQPPMPFQAIDDAALLWKPSRFNSGKKKGEYKGAPEGVKTTAHLRKLRKLLTQLVHEGAAYRWWYERSAEYVLHVTNGNFGEAEKLIELLAIYSPQAYVFHNTMFAIRAYTHWKNGGKREDFHVSSGTKDAKAIAVLYDNDRWTGVKTDAFYHNLMLPLLKIATREQLQALKIDPGILNSIKQKVTSDLWVFRAFGYRIAAAPKDLGDGKYSFTEGVIRQVAAELNKSLRPGEAPWEAHQVQAAIWSAIKARHEIPRVAEAAIAESVSKGLSHYEGAKYIAPTTAEARRTHGALWRRHALKATPTEVARHLEFTAHDFSNVLGRMTDFVPWEANPSKALKSPVNLFSPALLRAFTEEARALVIDDDGTDHVAERAGVAISYPVAGTGLFEGAVSANVISRVIPPKPAGEYGREEVTLYTRLLQFIFKQDAVPWFRLDPTIDLTNEIVVRRKGEVVAEFKGDEAVADAFAERDRREKADPKWVGYVEAEEAKDTSPAIARVRRRGNAVKRFDFQSDAQAYLEERQAQGFEGEVVSDRAHSRLPPFSRAWVLEMVAQPSPAAEAVFARDLSKVFGDIGYSQVGPGKFVLVNFRAEESGLPWSISDEDFFERLQEFRRVYGRKHSIAEPAWTVAEGDYGYVHDWGADPSGEEILGQASVAAAPGTHGWARDRRAAFEEVLARYEAEAPALEAALGKSENVSRKLMQPARGEQAALFPHLEPTGAGMGAHVYDVSTAYARALSRISEQIETPGFKAWAGEATFVLSPADHAFIGGEPVVVAAHHGTTHTIERVSIDERAQIENFAGPAFYATSSWQDAVYNYAGIGPDLNGRLAQRQQELQTELDDSPEDFYRQHEHVLSLLTLEDFEKYCLRADRGYFGWEDFKPWVVELVLKDALIGDVPQGQVRTVFVKLENPAVLDGWGREASQVLLGKDAMEDDFAPIKDAVEGVGFDLGAEDAGSRAYAALLEKYDENQNLTTWDLLNAIGFEFADTAVPDDIFRSASGLAKRLVLLALGYDGLILTAAGKAFRNMGGMPSDAVHVMTFEDASVKDVENRGTFAVGTSNLFDQPGPQEARGGVEFTPTGETIIRLSNTHDLSTMLHEGWHVFMEQFLTLVNSGTAPADVVNDWKQFREWAADNSTPLKKWIEANRTQGQYLDDRFGERVVEMALAMPEGVLKGQALLGDLLSQEGVPGVYAFSLQEYVAEMGERYLLEGKAPSVRLQSAFRRFRLWLKQLYQGVTKGSLDPRLTEFFDRLLATEEEVAAVEAEMGYATLQLDMSDAERARYRDLLEQARAQAREAVDERKLAEAKRREGARWKGLRSTVEAAVRRELEADPLRRADHWLRRGTALSGDDPPGIGPGKLNLGLVETLYGPEAAAGLTRGARGVATKSGSLDPRAVAPQFGLGDGFALVRALASLEPFERALKAAVDERMDAEHGSLESAVADAVEVAVRTPEAREKALLMEVELLRRKRIGARGQVTQVALEGPGEEATRRADVKRAREALRAAQEAQEPAAEQAAVVSLEQALEAQTEARTQRAAASARQATEASIERSVAKLGGQIKATAQRLVESTPIGRLRPEVFRAAEARANKNVRRLLRESKWDEAEVVAQQRLLNYHAYREALKVSKEADRLVRAAKRVTPKRLKKLRAAGRTYVDNIVSLLEQYDFRASVSVRAAFGREDLKTLANEIEQEGMYVHLPPSVTGDVRGRSYKTLSIRELRDVTDTLKSLEHLARAELARKKEIAQGKRENARLVFEGAANTRKGRRGYQPNSLNSKFKEHLKANASRVHAVHTKMEWLFRWLDGGEPNGPVWRLLYLPITQAADVKAEKMAELGKKLRALYESNYSKLEMAQWVWGAKTVNVPAIGRSLQRERVLMIALNAGNERNRAAVMESNAWDEAQLQAVLNTLDERDWEFVQGVLDLVNSLWPEISVLHERVTGVKPAKEAARPIVTKYGTFDGGYFPIKYDPNSNTDIAAFEEKKEVEGLFGGMWASKQTEIGHLTARREHTGKNKQVLLSFDVIERHLDQVVHDLTYREAVIEVARILHDKGVRKSLHEGVGAPMQKELNQWLQDIASNGRYPSGRLDAVVKRLHHGVSVAAMGWKLSTALLQPLGYSTTVKHLGVKYALLGLREFYGVNPMTSYQRMSDMREFILSRSTMMRQRGTNFDRDIRQAKERVGPRALMSDVDESFFWMIAQMQSAVDLPTWLGGYHQAMNGDVLNIDVGDEQAAAQYADSVVRLSQSHGDIKDLAGIQRGGPKMKLFTAFYSYFSALYNNLADDLGMTERVRDIMRPRTIANIFFVLVLPAVLEEAMREGRFGPDEDDDESWLWWAPRTVVGYGLSSIVLLRDVVRALDSGYGYEISPAAGAGKSAFRLYQQVQQGDLDEPFWRSFTDFVGFSFAIPTPAMFKYVQTFLAWAEGKDVSLREVAFGLDKENR